MSDYAKSPQEWSDRNAARLEQLRRSGEAKREAIESVRGHAQSRTGAVQAEVGSAGELLDLRLSDTALTMGPARLARVIQETINEARRAAADALTAALGTDAMDRAIEIRDELADRSGIGRPDPPAPPADDTLEEDWPTGRGFLRDP
ncbi:YbaB/EbfC family nucleoid-associated protein [Aldersonia sp. NBC_00410]|uniref:YbaB/EbfC family nucleoid-associated protein n=1 Tax=Aldersonia sp. NBC_00410 TaxID=2975954 RepID=UPI00224D26F2|nr:YbaB/EbfC family nucleoid-associated protein [Aldersonia sp. NBC_00410]MCX5042167.1 YbaB/EbfC family nucleoid-associated protein [Aldersonia sp. NBC_00410]